MIYNLEVVDVNTRRLRAFVAVAEELHFTRAAVKLFISQQSLSKQIADLENDVGTPLFERTSRKVELTAAGETLLRSAREALDSFDRGVEHARRIGRSHSAVLRLGFITGAALELTTHILSEFRSRFPEARVELHEFGLADPTAGLMSAETDVAFIRLPCTTQGLLTHTLFTEPCVVGVSTSHPLSGRESLRMSDLDDQPIAVGETTDFVWRDFWTLSSQAGPRSTRLIETHSQSEEMEVVAAGMACNVTPAGVKRYSPHPGIKLIPLEDAPHSVVAIAHRGPAPTELVAGFLRAAQAVLKREVALLETIESGGASPASPL